MELYCKTCNHQISTIDLQQTSRNHVTLGDGVELIEEGYYVHASEIDILFQQPIDVIVNARSIDLRYHKDKNKLTGCCGPGDLSQLNYICPQCSAEIGVIIEDCWLPHFVGISLEKTNDKPLW